MKNRILHLSVPVFLLFLTLSCSNDDSKVTAGIETRVFGRVYDNWNDLPVANQKLTISEWNSVPQWSPGPNDDFIQFLDSTYTDANGYYDMTFRTTGRGDLYFIEYEFNDSIMTYNQDRVEIEQLGTDTEVNYNFLHLYPVTLKITLAPDVEYLSIRIAPEYTFFTSPDWLTETNVEYSKTIFTNKNTDQNIRFFRTKPDGHYQTATFTLPATNTTLVTEFEVYITNDDFTDL